MCICTVSFSYHNKLLLLLSFSCMFKTVKDVLSPPLPFPECSRCRLPLESWRVAATSHTARSPLPSPALEGRAAMAHCMRWTDPPLHWTRWRQETGERMGERDKEDRVRETNMYTQMETRKETYGNINIDNKQWVIQELTELRSCTHLTPMSFLAERRKEYLEAGVSLVTLYCFWGP